MEIKVLVIDDSSIVRQTLGTILQDDAQIKVTGTAQDPIMAVRMIQSQRPDVIITGIEMARMSGLTFLKKINETIDPIPTIICSSLVAKGSSEYKEARLLGAADVIERPSSGAKQFLEANSLRICTAVKAAFAKGSAQAIGATVNDAPEELEDIEPETLQAVETPISPVTNLTQESARPPIPPKLSADVVLEKPDPKYAPQELTAPVVVIGASTGGTEALKDYLVEMPADSPAIVIVQHMPQHFTRNFANRLNSLCKLTVKEAENNDKVVPGTVLIAPGNYHMLLKRNGYNYFVEVVDAQPVNRHKPSVDVLFRSAAKCAGKNAIGIIMTGMGDDGSRGMKEMHDCGAYNLAQDEESSIVWGMPGEAVKAGAVDKVLNLQDLPIATINRAKMMQMNFKHQNSR